MIFDFEKAPPSGTVVRLDEQNYELRGASSATRRDGGPTVLLEWETECPSCGEVFAVITGLSAKSFNRRCANCRNPNKPVRGKRGRPLKVEIISS